MSHLVKFEMNLLEEKKMHALFSRRFVVGSSSSWQLTKSHWSQSRHILSHPLPSGLASSFSSSSVTRFVPSLLSLSEKAQGSGSLLEARAGFFDPQLLPKPWVFTGFQKRGWKSWFNGANGAVFGLIIANVAVLTMWKTSDPQWMSKNFVLSSYTFMSGRIHTLITSGFSNVGTSQLIVNMIGLYYFGTSIARTLGPVYLLKLYFAGTLAGSLLFVSVHGVMAILKSQGVSYKGQSKPIGMLVCFFYSYRAKEFPCSQIVLGPQISNILTLIFFFRIIFTFYIGCSIIQSYMVSFKDQSKLTLLLGAEGPLYAITLLDIFLYPKVTTYFAFIFRVPIMMGILALGQDLVKVLEGKKKSLTIASIHMGGGAMVAAIAWRQIRKGRFYY
ncbi:rhomboid-like protein 16, chloroplastic isoform X2 [Brassica rapa]|uniref:rhomboid-like protein 16, chloroplastic isoform X2 n=1 Tax=Brassica campestris TaxID=3711 RepID=UPI00142E4240|nr:rhomboid-like protein 16, chloroplastic isoform X2 [Brassica rapa]